MVFAILFWSSLGLYGASIADEPNISLGPGVFTFREIARNLSVQGRSVEIASNLRDGAAFVNLKHRPWTIATSVLCRGLDLSLQKKAGTDTGWILSRNQQVLDRERGWRRRFAQNLQAYMEARLRRSLEYLQPSAVLQANMSALKEEMDRLKGDGQEGGTRYHTLETNYYRMRAASFWGPSHRLSIAWLSQNFPSVRDVEGLVESGEYSVAFPIGRFPASLFGPVIDQLGQTKAGERYDHGVSSFLFTITPQQAILRANLYLYSSTQVESLAVPDGAEIRIPDPDAETGDEVADPINWIFKGSPASAEPVFGGLGAQAVDWLRAQRDKTSALLKSAQTQIQIPTPASGSEDLSPWIAAWSRRLDTEAMMELCPGREAFDEPNAKTITRSSYSLRELMAAAWPLGRCPWTLEDVDGVLLVHDRLAFLDRPRQRPMAALVPVLRYVEGEETRASIGRDASPPSTVPRGNPHEIDRLPFVVLREYVHEVMASPHAYWTYPDYFSNEYRGWQLGDVDQAVPGAYLWEHLPDRERRKLALSAERNVLSEAISLTQFTPQDRRTVLAALERWGSWNWETLLPTASDWVQSLTLTVRLTPVTDHPGTFLVSLDLDPRPYGAVARFVWQDAATGR